MSGDTDDMETNPRPRILFLDAYDSFTNNITSLLTTLLDVDVYVVPIDAPLTLEDFKAEVAKYDAVVCGPGPGSPSCEKDVGLMRLVWDLDVPVLGICLGSQSLVVACGGRVGRLRRGLHGMVREVKHLSEDMFEGADAFKATLYHSLGVVVPGRDELEVPMLQPLAWVDERRDDGETDTILMAVKHRTRPYWGLQYHPESVCTDAKGNKVISNWFSLAMRWNRESKRIVDHGIERVARKATKESLLSRPSLVTPLPNSASNPRPTHLVETLPLPSGIQVPNIVEMLDGQNSEHIVLDSANAMLPAPVDGVSDVRGRYSIIGLDIARASRIEYVTGDEYATFRRPATGFTMRVDLDRRGGIWGYLADFQRNRRLQEKVDLPFLGGFMGYVSYEQGLSDIGVKIPVDRGHRRADVCLVWVTRSVIVDHRTGSISLQELDYNHDLTWLDRTKERLVEGLRLWTKRAAGAFDMFQTRKGAEGLSLSASSIQKPSAAEYEAKVKECQEYIAAGNSYELCLTDQTTITRPRSRSITLVDKVTSSKKRRHSSTQTQTQAPLSASSWQLFRTLRTRQPAPFASYLRLGPATLISASPERFLTYDRQGHVSMRPMKGTVRKSGEVSTLAQAEVILHVPKEEAENLMIVDLVRHDLHGVCGAGNVTVKELMKVEEYESVFQMITVVEGQLPAAGGYTGLDVLAASLPPGSMTGAPKKRSCEILRELEGGRERGLYSGVVGYMCASGRGDWSVTIRSLFRWDDECSDGEAVWRIGAGGAVTILSTPEGEAEEMFTKLAGPLGIFEDPV